MNVLGIHWPDMPPMNSWEAVEAMAAVAAAVGTVFGTILIWRTIAKGVRISKSEKFVDAFMEFTRTVKGLSLTSQMLRREFEAGNRSITEYELSTYIHDSWWFNLNEWQFYQAGIIPIGIYARWAASVHEHLTSDRVRGYYDADGQAVTLSAWECYQTYAAPTLEYYPHFMDLVKDLKALPRAARNRKDYIATVERLIRRQRSHRYWRYS